MIYLITSTTKIIDFMEDEGIEILKNESNYNLLKIKTNDRTSIIDALYNTAIYGDYTIISKNEYNKIKKFHIAEN